jgi:hypothetical protein
MSNKKKRNLINILIFALIIRNCIWFNIILHSWWTIDEMWSYSAALTSVIIVSWWTVFIRLLSLCPRLIGHFNKNRMKCHVIMNYYRACAVTAVLTILPHCWTGCYCSLFRSDCWNYCFAVRGENNFIAAAGRKPSEYELEPLRDWYKLKLISVFVHYYTRKTNLLIRGALIPHDIKLLIS